MVRRCLLLAALPALLLAAAPPAEPPEAAGLIARLASDDDDVRRDAMKSLDELGEDALGALRRAAATIKDPDARLRASVVAAGIRRRLWGEVGRFTGHKGWVYRVALTPDGKYAVSSGDAVRVWELATGKEVRRMSEGAWGWGLSVSRDGKRVLASGQDQHARLFDLETGKMLQRFGPLGDEVWVACLSPDGKTALTGALNGSLRAWDAATGKLLRAFESTRDLPRCAAWSPDGKRVAVGHFAAAGDYLTRPGTLRVWDAETGKPLLAGPGHAGPITSVGWSADGKRLVTSSFDRTVRVWDAATCKELKRLTVSAHGCDGVAFLPDGERVVAAGWGPDRDVTVWDVRTARRLARFEGHEGNALCVAVTPDGKRAVSSAADGTVRVWPLSR